MKISQWVTWISLLTHLYFINSAIAENIDWQEGGIKAFQTGHFIDAIKQWEKVIQSDESSSPVKTGVFIHQAEALQRLGDYCQAEVKLQQARNQLEKQGQTYTKEYVQVLISLGHLCTHYTQSTCEVKPTFSNHEKRCDMNAAMSYLSQGFDKVKAIKNAHSLKLLLHLHRGNYYALQAKRAQMKSWDEDSTVNRDKNRMLADYDQAIKYAKEMAHFSLAIKVTNNAVISLLNLAKDRKFDYDSTQDKKRAKTYLNSIVQDLLPRVTSANGEKKPVSSFEQADILLTTGQLILANQDLFQEIQEFKEFKEQPYRLFKRAESIAQAMANSHVESLANGHLSKLYGSKKHYPEALQLIQKAIFLAQQASHSEPLLFQWYRYKGDLLKAQQQLKAAEKAYRQAILSLEQIRSDIEAFDQDNQINLRQIIRPTYMDLLELLFKQAEQSTGNEKQLCEPVLPSLNLCQQEKSANCRFPQFCEFPISRQPISQQACYLINVLAIIERYNNFELRNYYQDECVTQQKTCASLTQLISKETAIIYHLLFPNRPVALLYFSDGHIQPIDLSYDGYTLQNVEQKVGRLLKYLRQEGISDNNAKFLYQHFFKKIEQALKSRNIKTLVFVPDEYLRPIPMAILRDENDEYLLQKYAISVTPSLVLTRSSEKNLKNKHKHKHIKLLLNGLSKSPHDQSLPELPYVKGELKSLAALFPTSKQLLNEHFHRQALFQALAQTDNPHYSGIHIASHTTFRANSKKTVIKTFNDSLSIDDLKNLVDFNLRRQQPIELLTLSACKTAVDEKHAALGLAGIAVKTGVPSALATLWNVNDQSTAKLIEQFYQNYKQGNTKAKALQKAQLAFLNKEITRDGKSDETSTFTNPYYWAPFILIGNWQ